MSENKSNKHKGKVKKCKIKCRTCEFYDAPFDYCTKKEIEDCSSQTNINFSSCEEYLVKEELVMF